MKDTIKLQYCSERDVQKMHEATLDILAQTGIKCFSESVVSFAKEVGLDVTDDPSGKGSRIRFTRSVVEKALQDAPKSFTMYGLDDKYQIKWGEKNAYNHTCVGVPFVTDVETGKRRNTSLADLEDYIRLADALPNTDIISCLTAQGIPEHAANAVQVAAMVKNTTKPLRVCIHDAQETEDVVNVFAAAVGSKEALVEKPIAYLEVSPISPMEYADDPAEAILSIVDSGLPLGVIPCPMIGATGPMTVVGSVVMHNAEILAGVTLAQLRKPGHPTIMSPRVTFMEMSTAMGLWAAPEMGLAATLSAELMRYYNMPCTVTGFSCGSKVSDAQAAFESMYNTLIPALVGVDVCGASGSLDNVLEASYEKLVIDNEIASLVQFAIKGYDVNEDTCAVDVVRDVVDDPSYGGNFLGHPHTMKHLRSELWKPYMSDRDIYENWQNAGSKNFTERAHELVVDILANHHPQPISDDKVKAVEAVVQACIDRK
ncbi:MAG TPA: trimethylamine methyltransferase family protein [Firmicutes bacterium]|nr:trimethylamine methyltransferase family protein [Bacillota bacterium]